jgi:serine protease Do
MRSISLSLLLLLSPPALALEPDDLQARMLRARDRVFPALVHVEPIVEVFQRGERGRMAVTGSGAIISEDGLVLTNAHVVENAERVTCVLSDRREIPSEVVGRDEATDLAVLRLDASALEDSPVPVAVLGSSAELEVGQWVMAMGSPLGLARSVSLGVVSALDRYLPADQLPGGAETGAFNTWIQTDAAINPGNSGGPLVDLEGRVVGINARAITVLGENVGFAIPVDVAHRVIPDLVSEGRVARSYSGLHLQSLRALPESRRHEVPDGVIVGGVDEGSPAALAGIVTGDLILDWQGEPTVARFEDQLPEIRQIMASSEAGAQVSVTVWKEGRTLEISLAPVDRQSRVGDDFEAREWGFTTREVTEAFARDLNLVDARGVIVTGVKPGSFAEKAGINPRQVIIGLAEQPVETLEDFARIYREAVEGRPEMILVETRAGIVLGWSVLRPVYETEGEEENDDDAR